MLAGMIITIFGNEILQVVIQSQKDVTLQKFPKKISLNSSIILTETSHYL